MIEIGCLILSRLEEAKGNSELATHSLEAVSCKNFKGSLILLNPLRDTLKEQNHAQKVHVQGKKKLYILFKD